MTSATVYWLHAARFLLSIMLVAAAGAAASCSPTSMNIDAMAADVERLEPILDLAADLQLEGFINASSCHLIDYAEGAFADNLEATTCFAERQPVPFTESSYQTWERVRTAVDETGVPIAEIYLLRYNNGRLTHAEFALQALWGRRLDYVYDAHGAINNRDMEPVLINTPISETWYLRSEEAY